jgi:hypothetical protein
MMGEDEIFVTWADLKRLVRAVRRKLVIGACGGALAAMAFVVKRGPVYEAEATFLQAGGRAAQVASLQALFKQGGGGESSVTATMLSRRHMEGVAQQLGLQIRPAWAETWLGRAWEHLCVELGWELEDREECRFTQVEYAAPKQAAFSLLFSSEEAYEVRDAHGSSLGDGKVGERWSGPEFSFTVAKAPKNMRLGCPYRFRISPLPDAAASLLCTVEIKSDNRDPSVLHIFCRQRDRFTAARVVNQVMASYQRFLKEDNERVARGQLAYLEQRQRELAAVLDSALRDYVAYSKENLGEHGCLTVEQQLEEVAHPRSALVTRLFALDLEAKRLEKSGEGEPPHAASFVPDPSEEMSALNRREAEVHSLLDALRRGDALPQENSLPAAWVRQMHGAVEGEESGSRSLSAYLAQYAQVLEGKKRALQENLLYREASTPQLSGVDPELARQMLFACINERDKGQLMVRRLLFLSDQLFDPEFELASISNVLGDPVSLSVVQKARDLALALQDTHNHSARERERLLGELDVQKRFLSHYLAQAVELEKLQVKLLDAKIDALSDVSLDLVNRERGLLKERLAELSRSMGDLPDKWCAEKMLTLRTDLTKEVIRGLAQMVEAKVVEYNTFQVESKPIDEALVPSQPKKARLFLFSLIGALLGGAGVFGASLCTGLLRGLPLSSEGLRVLGKPVAGSLTPHGASPLDQLPRTDMETLRNVAAFLAAHKGEKGLACALLAGRHPNYASNLAELLSVQERRVILVEAVFDAVVPPEAVPGLWHYLTSRSEAPPVRCGALYAVLPSGGTSAHGAEWFRTERFLALLRRLRTQYDYVLLYNRSPVLCAEARALADAADAAIWTIGKESAHDLALCSSARSLYLTFDADGV